MRFIPFALLVPFILAGCSVAAPSVPAPTSAASQGTVAPSAAISASASPSPVPSPVAARSAADVLSQLKSKGLPVGQSVTYTAETDVNNLLGRPGQYTSKVNFQDTRLAPQSTNFDVGDGGSIEVFANAEDARRRRDYVEAISKSASFLVEYQYLEGLVLLRLSRRLTPDQAAAYQTALK